MNTAVMTRCSYGTCIEPVPLSLVVVVVVVVMKVAVIAQLH